MTSTSLVPGRHIGEGKYELLSPLGRGAMGWVWLARHVALNRMVAVKFLHSDLNLGRAHANTIARKEFASERFLKEARTASLLRHRNTVQLLDYGADVEDRWLVMEYLEGKNLADVLHEVASFDPPRSIAIMAQVLAALAEAHDFGIVHRDLKPANVMLVPWVDDDGRETEMAKVLDFGIATMMSDEVADTNEVAGTPEYMSPEQAQALEVDQRSDVYAAGVLLYHLLTGDTPFSDPMPLNTMLSHVNDAPRPPSQLNPVISPRLEALIMSALEKSPDDRPESARAFRTALLALPEAKGLRPDSSPRLDPVTIVGVSTAPSTRSATRAPTLSYLELSPTQEPRRRARVAFWIGIAAVVVAGATLWATGVLTPSPSAEGIELVSSAPNQPTPPAINAVQPTTLERPMPPTATGAPTEALAKAPEEGATYVATAARPAAVDAAPIAPETDAALANTEQAAPIDTTATGTSAAGGSMTASKVSDTDPATQPSKPDSSATAPARRDTKDKRPTPDKASRVDAAAPKDAATTVTAKAPVIPVVSTTPPTGPTHKATAAVADPPKPVEAKVLPVAPDPVAPSRPPSLSATATIGGLQSRGSLPRSAIARAIDGARPAIEVCYTNAARSVGRDLGGQLSATLVFDGDGKVTSVKLGSSGPAGLTSCINTVLWKARLRERPDTGGVDASFRIIFTPRSSE